MPEKGEATVFLSIQSNLKMMKQDFELTPQELLLPLS